MNTVKFLLFSLVAFLLAGCSHTVTYNPSYIRNAGITTVPKYSGKLLIYNTAQENRAFFQKGPESFTGWALSLGVPLGEYAKSASGEVYGHLFINGFENTDNVNPEQSGQFAAILHPVIENYAWRMNQAKNAGFAITPQVKMSLHFQLMSATNIVLFDRVYESGWTDGESYAINFSPLETVNQATHKTLVDLMKQSILDMDSILHNNSVTAASPINVMPAIMSVSALKVVGYNYEAKTQSGSLSVDISNYGLGARDWIVQNIGKICSSKEVLLEAGQEKNTGGHYRVLNESLKNGVLTIDFTAGYESH